MDCWPSAPATSRLAGATPAQGRTSTRPRRASPAAASRFGQDGGGTRGRDRSMLLFRYWSLLRRYLRPQRAKVCGLAVLVFGGIGLQLVTPQILRYVVDAAREGESTPRAGKGI